MQKQEAHNQNKYNTINYHSNQYREVARNNNSNTDRHITLCLFFYLFQLKLLTYLYGSSNTVY
jgi:hypothetical protein